MATLIALQGENDGNGSLLGSQATCEKPVLESCPDLVEEINSAIEPAALPNHKGFSGGLLFAKSGLVRLADDRPLPLHICQRMGKGRAEALVPAVQTRSLTNCAFENGKSDLLSRAVLRSLHAARSPRID